MTVFLSALNRQEGAQPYPPDRGTSSRIAFHWLLRLRWGAVCCQILLIVAVFLFFHMTAPVFILTAIIAFEVVSNLYFHYLESCGTEINDWLFALVMFLDIALFTALLYYTGGPMNPFTFLYLVHVALGAMLMRPLWSWSLAAFAALSYATLFLLPEESAAQPLCHVEPAGLSALQGRMQLHLHGMWAAFVITAMFIVFFVGKIQKALEKHQKTLADLKAQKIRNEKLASLATLAAGAAHELSTPLSTIAVAAGETLHVLRKSDLSPELLEDARLIRSQVEHCKEILYQMAADAGEHMGEEIHDLLLRDVIATAVASFEPPDIARIKITNRVGDMPARLPARTMSRIIRGLIQNGLDASPKEASVRLACFVDQRYVFFEVADQGAGMDQETADKAAEPFFTRKEPGKGLGLGLFLAKSAAERFGGGLRIRSATGRGTTVTIFFDRNQIKPLSASIV